MADPAAIKAVSASLTPELWHYLTDVSSSIQAVSLTAVALEKAMLDVISPDLCRSYIKKLA